MLKKLIVFIIIGLGSFCYSNITSITTIKNSYLNDKFFYNDQYATAFKEKIKDLNTYKLENKYKLQINNLFFQTDIAAGKGSSDHSHLFDWLYT